MCNPLAIKPDHGYIIIAEFVFIGDEIAAYNDRFIRHNKITHILNTSALSIIDIFCL